MSVEAPLCLHRGTIRPEWIDYNGHMNVAYYVLVFDQGTDALLDAGVDDKSRAKKIARGGKGGEEGVAAERLKFQIRLKLSGTK